MKVFFEYATHDHQDSWVVYREQCAKEAKNDAISPITHEKALVCHTQYPSDYCFISFIPAARGEKVGELYHNDKNKVFIQLSNREDTEHYLTRKPYLWNDAIDIGAKYVGMTFKAGVRSWKTKKY